MPSRKQTIDGTLYRYEAGVWLEAASVGTMRRRVRFWRTYSIAVTLALLAILAARLGWTF